MRIANYLAYLLALGDLDRDTVDARLAELALEVAQESIVLLDVIVFLPAGEDGSVVPVAEDPKLRRAVDERLEGIFLDDDSRLFTDERPAVVEAWGTSAERLRIVEASCGSSACRSRLAWLRAAIELRTPERRWPAEVEIPDRSR